MLEKVILFAKKSDCCGCSACYAVCPQSAITMEPDEEGFLFPHINEDLCIKCGQCMSVCAFKKDRKEKGR